MFEFVCISRSSVQLDSQICIDDNLTKQPPPIMPLLHQHRRALGSFGVNIDGHHA